MPHISFLGIGLMGAPMVARLLDAGFFLTLWNRTLTRRSGLPIERSLRPVRRKRWPGPMW